MCEAVVTVSPNRQYLGMVRPTTPATTGPVKELDNHTQIFVQTASEISLPYNATVWIHITVANSSFRISEPLEPQTFHFESSYQLHAVLSQTWAFLCTWMKSDAYFDFYLWHVFDFKRSDGVQDVQRHVGHFSSVSIRISVGNTWCHHVGVANGLHLQAGHAQCSTPVNADCSFHFLVPTCNWNACFLTVNPPYKHREWQWWRQTWCRDHSAGQPPVLMHKKYSFLLAIF